MIYIMLFCVFWLATWAAACINSCMSTYLDVEIPHTKSLILGVCVTFLAYYFS